MTLIVKNLSISFPYKSKKKTGLHDINLKFEDKERIGILGNNGAGKSTLLRVLGRIFYPDKGVIIGSKKVYSIFNFNSGIDPELTGLQNIYRIGIIRQINKDILDKNIKKLVEFTELNEKIYDPVYTYSNGMRMRIGITLLQVVNPKIIIFDEGLGAGDIRIINKIKELIKTKIQNSAISFISSHSMKIIKQLTSRCIILNNGSVAYDGKTEDAIKFYQQRK